MKVSSYYNRDGKKVSIGDTVKFEVSEECHLKTNGLISKIYGIDKSEIYLGGGSVDDGYEPEYRTQYDFILHYPDEKIYREVSEPFYSCRKID